MKRLVGRIGIVALAFVALGASRAVAQEVDVFGPEVFERVKGKPKTVTRAFDLEPGEGAPFFLHLVNGDPQGNFRVSSAHVWLNGSEVVGPANFNQQVGVILREVHLEAENTLQVRVTSAPGAYFTLRFSATSGEPPPPPPPPPTPDTTPPGAVLDLTVTGGTTDSIVLSWTAPGDDGPVGTAVLYDVRYALSPILSEADFDAAVQAFGEPQPLVAGSLETFAVTGLLESTTYVFALRSHDEAGNVAPLSNSPTATTGTTPPPPPTPDTTPPAAVLDLVITGATEDSLALSWTAPGDDGSDGMAALYDVRYALAPITNEADFDAAMQAAGEPLPQIAGSLETFAVMGLSSGTTYAFAVKAIDEAGNVAPLSNSPMGTTLEPPPPPPPPPTPPPAPPPAVAMDIGASTAFLYEGSDPVQTDVAPGTIEARRVAVVRGTVLDRDGNPLPDVLVTIPKLSEFGKTKTQANGEFDLAVNGGGAMVLRYSKAGYAPVYRRVEVPWREFVVAPDVVMTELDPIVTTIDLTAATPIQVASGSVQSDDFGSRRAHLLFAQGTTAKLQMPGGSMLPISSLSVRATEYTVGDAGPKAMPALLPPQSIYTYCAELSVDEALTQNAEHVVFSQPVIAYVDNFLDFPVGGAAPAGYYDPATDGWIAIPDGRVIGVLASGIDLTGSGLPATATELAALGITGDELATLTNLYAPGEELWRVRVSRFSPCDVNWPGSPPPGAGPPPSPPPPGDGCPGCCASGGGGGPGGVGAPGSQLELGVQSLGEVVPVVGTPFELNYRSDRVRGSAANMSVTIPISGATLHPDLIAIRVDVQVAGRLEQLTFPALPNQSHVFTWDGLDAYGREVQGRQPCQVRVSNIYPATYTPPSAGTTSFGELSTSAVAIGRVGRGRASLFVEYKTALGVWDARGVGLGGWMLDQHHAYEPASGRLNLGSGGYRSGGEIPLKVIETLPVAGLSGSYGLAVAPNGDLFIADRTGGKVLRVDATTGAVSVFAGGGASQLDGVVATTAQLLGPEDVDVDSQGRVYIADHNSHRIRRIGSDGLIWTIAGSGPFGFTLGATSGDEGPATSARMNRPRSVCLDEAGGFYIACSQDKRVRYVDPAGIIHTVAGNGTNHAGDGGLAINAGITLPVDAIAIPGGGLYIIDGQTDRVRLVNRKGYISTVAGIGGNGFSGDGGPGTAAQLADPFHGVMDRDGALLIADMNNSRIRRLDPQGIITSVVGDGIPCGTPTNPCGDGSIALLAQLQVPRAVTVGPDGTWYIGDSGRIRRIRPAFPGFSVADRILASDDGKELYRFDGSGRHLQTLDAYTATAIHEFGYDAAGLLISITDRSGNVTAILRDGLGTPDTILAPFGQETAVTLDANGYLDKIILPSGDDQRFTYSPLGLMSSMTDPRGSVHTFTYDTIGRVVRDDDPSGGFQTMSRTDFEDGFEVTHTTASGVSSTYRSERTAIGGVRRVNTFPTGDQAEYLFAPDGTVATTHQDGTTETSSQAADPRWGMSAPVPVGKIFTTPGGRNYVMTSARSVTLANPADPFSLISSTTSWTVNGKTTTETYTAATRTRLTTMPTGRKVSEILDTQGRLIQRQVIGMEPVSYGYDTQGRLVTETMGTGAGARTQTRTYDAAGFVASMTDSAGQTTTTEMDGMGRVTRSVLPDGAAILLGWDAAGNKTTLQPPGRAPHLMSYTALNQLESYDPPDSGIGSVDSYTFDGDRRMTSMVLSGKALTISFNSEGMPAELAHADAVLSLGYESSAGCCTVSQQPVSIVRTPASGPAVILDFTYDGSLPLDDVLSGPVSGSYERTYNNDLLVASDSINGSSAATYLYDSDGLMTKAGALTITRHSQHGLVTATNLGNVTTSHTYNGFGEVTATTASFSGAPFYDVSYTYDALGRVVRRVETIQAVTDTYDYSYDARGRLIESRKNGSTSAAYTYDANGNRLSYTDSGGTVNASYDDQDRLVQYGTTSYAYDADGTLVSMDEGGGAVTSFHYDVFGALISVSNTAGMQVGYSIAGYHQRVGKSLGGSLVAGFLYDGALPVAELDATRSVVSRFVYDGAETPTYMVRGGITYRIVSDRVGSTRLVVDVATGLVAQRMDYDEFGVVTSDTNPGFQPFGFGAGLHDLDTKLTRFGRRDYDARTGRWTSRDPLRFFGLDTNLYAYVGSDPVNLVDPSGLAAKSCEPAPPPPPITLPFQNIVGRAWNAISTALGGGGGANNDSAGSGGGGVRG